ncbi:MAG: 2-phosphosulfolactate phosphatase, partial [Bacteroidales bacterium]|nr:2-phosphosulfolactate phosphatase [Bacteroidales bacterium]
MTPDIDIVFAPDLYRYHKKHFNIVLIDVLRFTSSLTTALANGALSVETFADEDTPLKLKKEQNYIICGEYKGEQLDGYDFNNSPVDMTKENVGGRKLAFCTTNGTYTRSVIYDYDRILAGSFLNFSALTERLKNDNKPVTLVCSGSARKPAVEDLIFAGKVADFLTLNCGFSFSEDSAGIAINLYKMSKNRIKDFVLESAPS